MVLEEVALDAVVADGRLIARTSARRLAEGLGIDPGTAAGALRDLREKGVLALERESGVAGRFGLAVYVLQRLDGLAVVTPADGMPGVEEPHVDRPHMATSDTDRPRVAGTAVRGDRAAGGGPAQRRAAGQASRGSSGVGWSGGAGLGFGVGVRAPGVASPEGWQVSVARSLVRF